MCHMITCFFQDGDDVFCADSVFRKVYIIYFEEDFDVYVDKSSSSSALLSVEVLLFIIS